jgi:Sulfotransferase domain
MSEATAVSRAKDGVRTIAATVGHATSELRMAPDFLIVGAQRCGTTSLFRDLAEHPAVVPPLFQKGIHFFDLHYGRGLRWYRGQFPVRSIADRRVAPTAPRAVTGEASPYYVFHPLAAERIARDLPAAKLIALLRDPVDRAFSAHRQESARGFETEPFERALDLEESRLADEVERIRADPAYVSFEHQHHAYLARSRYVDQVRRLLDTFGTDRVMVMDAEALFADPQGEVARLCEWLRIDPPAEVADEQWNAQPRDPLSAERRAELNAYFAPFDEELSVLLGRPLSWRTTDPSPGSS